MVVYTVPQPVSGSGTGATAQGPANVPVPLPRPATSLFISGTAYGIPGSMIGFDVFIDGQFCGSTSMIAIDNTHHTVPSLFVAVQLAAGPHNMSIQPIQAPGAGLDANDRFLVTFID